MALVAAGIIFTSCSKDDDAPKQDQLIGTWLQIESSIIEQGEASKETLSECAKKTVLVLNRMERMKP